MGNSGSEFHDGLLEVSISGGKYVDRSGKVALDPDLDRGWDFSDGLAVAMRKGENLWGYIDTTGAFAISPRFPTYPHGYVHSFSDGVAMVEAKGRFGFIDRSGAFTIPPRFLDATNFAGGIARVVVEGPCVYFPDGPCPDPRFPGVGKEDRAATASSAYPPCKFTYIDKSGSVITQQRLDYGRGFSEGLAPVRLGRLWGFIDRAGSLAIPPTFEDAKEFSSGLSKVLSNGRFGFIDKSGEIAIGPRFKVAEGFSEGLAAVADGNGRYWFIDRHGMRAFAGEFAIASSFFKGLAHVKLLEPGKDSATHAYIDTSGRHVFRY